MASLMGGSIDTIMSMMRLGNTIVKLRSRSRSGEGQVRVRMVRVRSVSGQLKGFNFELKIWT